MEGPLTAAEAIKAFRKARGDDFSQGDLAALVGVKRETVTRWESGARKVDPELLPTVSEKTGIPKQVLRPDLAELMGEAN